MGQAGQQPCSRRSSTHSLTHARTHACIAQRQPSSRHSTKQRSVPVRQAGAKNGPLFRAVWVLLLVCACCDNRRVYVMHEKLQQEGGPQGLPASLPRAALPTWAHARKKATSHAARAAGALHAGLRPKHHETGRGATSSAASRQHLFYSFAGLIPWGKDPGTHLDGRASRNTCVRAKQIKPGTLTGALGGPGGGLADDGEGSPGVNILLPLTCGPCVAAPRP